MGLFEDKKYDSLDWMSQAVEPVETDFPGVFLTIPETFELDFNTYKVLSDSYYNNDISIDLVLLHIKDLYFKREMSQAEYNLLKSRFDLQFDPGTEVDFEEKVIRGSIRLVKKNQPIEEKDLIRLIDGDVEHTLGRFAMFNNNVDISKINEILEILGGISPEDMKIRSSRSKLRVIAKRMKAIFEEDEWRIRDITLGKKISKWIVEYITSGNLAALSNLCRLKLMTHSGKGIYSIEETK